MREPFYECDYEDDFVGSVESNLWARCAKWLKTIEVFSLLLGIPIVWGLAVLLFKGLALVVVALLPLLVLFALQIPLMFCVKQLGFLPPLETEAEEQNWR